jgi:protoporphyrinogen oxidase
MRSQIAILGAGPAGLALGLTLLRRSNLHSDVIIFDLKPYVGGLTASFERDGLYFDHGSHRLHPATSEEILRDIRTLLGPDLLDRPRNGRISLLGRLVKFPLNPVDLALHLPFSFVRGFIWDIVSRPLRKKHQPHISFADALLDGLGETICREFYFPYARKLWGLNPEDISVVQAHKRVSANNLSKILGKVFGVIPGIRQEGAGRFYYPVKGYGQISEALAQEVKRLGGHIHLSTVVQEIHLQQGQRIKLLSTPVSLPENGASEGRDTKLNTLEADFVFVTIPMTVLVQLLRPEPPPEVKHAAQNLHFRAMVLHYLILEADHFSPYDAHYFPGEEVIFSRISEPKNYSAAQEPQGLTSLCFEIPCQVGDHIWQASEEELTQRVKEDMEKVRLPITIPIRASFSRHISHVYPIYDANFELHFQALDAYLSNIPGLVPLGRQALFAHDNTHHTMEMAYCACECLQPNLSWDAAKWQQYRQAFTKHVVVD